MNSRVVVKRLYKEGWLLRGTKGSHHQFVPPHMPGRHVTVPHPTPELTPKTLHSIMKQAGWKDWKRK